LDELLGGGKDSAFGQACQTMAQAFEAEDSDEQLQWGRRALAFCPDLADVYVALVEYVRSRNQAIARSLQGLAAPERVFGGRDCAEAEVLAEVGAVVTIAPDWSRTLGPVSPRHFGHNTVWVRGGLGLWDEARQAPNPEVLQLVTALRPGVLRFPGGTRAMRYHFAQAIGPRSSRTPQCDPFTGARDGTGYGLDEFLQVIVQVGAEVTLVSPWVDGTPEEAAALVAYVNADPGSNVPIGRDENGMEWGTAGDWAQRRVAHGHPQPYGVPFLEIGNEQYSTLTIGPPLSCGRPAPFRQSERWVNGRPIPTTAADHATQVARTGRLVRAVDPTILIGVSAYSTYDGQSDAATAVAPLDQALGTGDPWNARLVRDAGDAFFFILHPYNLNLFTLPADPLSLAEGLRKTVHDLRALDPSKQSAVTEFGYLSFAGSFLGVLLAAHIVRVAVEEQLLMNLRHILIEDTRSPFEPFAMSAALLPPDHTTMPGYWAMQLLARNLGGDAVPTETTAADLVAFAARDQGGGGVTVVLIRQHTIPAFSQTAKIALPPGVWSGTIHTLFGPFLTAPRNLIGYDPEPVVQASGVLQLRVPPHALVVVRLGRQ
jgi:hypothetical protein